MRILVRLMALLLTLPVLGVVTPAVSTPASPGPDPASSSTAPAAASVTRIVIRSQACEGCDITAVSALPRRPIRNWTATVKNGRAAFRVPTARTRRLYFIVNETTIPGVTGGYGAAPIAVMRYKGIRAGRRVSAARAAKGRYATGCWAGTARARVVLNLRVDLFRGRDTAGNPAILPRLWFSPGHRTWGPMNRAWRGTTGTQDAFYCTRPSDWRA